MRAIVITRPGPPEVLELQTRPDPTPSAGEILVRVHATALNRADILQREGRYPAPAGAPPDIPGLEFAGEVLEAGDGATKWKAGDRVFGIVGGGAYADRLVTHEDTVARIPEKMSWTDAAAVPEVFITAHDALRQAATISGDNVLIHAAGSGVALAAIQICRALGAIPFGTARTADKIARAKSFGLEDGLVVGDTLDTLREHVMRWTNGRGADVTLDLLGGPYLPASIASAAKLGRIVLIGTIAGRAAQIPLGDVLAKRLTIRGTVLRARSIAEKADVTRAFEREVLPSLADGRIRPVVDSVFPLADASAAHERMESNETFGKVVLSLD